jgi:hypothetical protein
MTEASRDTAAYLDRVQRQGGWTKVKAYTRLSGPGWLQSAITLGGGSLASALFLGVVGGYSVLWVQAGAIILGVIMLAAIGYVTLSTGESPSRCWPGAGSSPPWRRTWCSSCRSTRSLSAP